METLDHSWLERGNQDRVVGRSRGKATPAVGGASLATPENNPSRTEESRPRCIPPGDRAGRVRLSETAGSQANHRPVRPNTFASSNGSRPNRGSYVRDPAVSERHARPAPFARLLP